MYDAAVALRDAMIELGLACDGGKDSLSMAASAGGEVRGSLFPYVLFGCELDCCRTLTWRAFAWPTTAVIMHACQGMGASGFIMMLSAGRCLLT